MMSRTLPILAAAASLAAVSTGHAQTYSSEPPPPAYAPGYSPDYAPEVGEVVVTAPDVMRGDRRIRSVPVYFADLNLDSPDGGYTLLTRIRGAARQACQPGSDMRDLADTADFQRCVRRAIHRAVNQVGAPSVQDAFYDLGVGAADLPGQ